jgi:hypothetical protein
MAVRVERLKHEAGRHRPEEAVTIIQIVDPFVIAEQIGPRNLDLDDGQDPARADRHHVGPAPVGQRHLAQCVEILAVEQAGDSARHVLGHGRLVGEAAGIRQTRSGGHGSR